MGDLAQTLGINGAGHEVTIGDKSLVFVPIVQVMKDKFAEWVRKRARQAALENQLDLIDKARELRQEIMSNEDMEFADRERLQYQVMALERSAGEQLSIYADKRAAGHYEFHGRLCSEALSTTVGTGYLSYLMLKPRQPELTAQEVLDMLVEHAQDFENALREVQRLGKHPSPGEKTE